MNFFNFVKSQYFQIKHGDIDLLLSKLVKLLRLVLANTLSIIFFPLLLLIYLISNFYLIRFCQIPTDRIGHFALEVDL